MSEIFRDPTEGAKAKRTELLRRRRDELVTMPHAVRRVVVARVARIAASLAVFAAGTAMVIAATTPSLAAWVTRGLPGIQPAPLSTLLVATWLIGIAAHSIARSVAEHRFAVAMSRYVLPGDSLHDDLERLSHEHPDAVARAMAHRLEVGSAALPVLAAATLLPATLLYGLEAIRARGWPASEFEAAIATHGSTLAAIAAVGIAASIVVTRRAARGPGVAPIAAGVAAGCAVLTIVTSTWWFVAPAVIAATLALVGRRLRFERAQIHADDPAAGSEVFTMRGLVRRIRSTIVAIRPRLTRVNVVRVVAVGAALVAASWGRVPSSRAAHRTARLAHAPVIAPGTPGAAPESSTYTVQRVDGALHIAIKFRDRQGVVIPTLPGLDQVPVGWRVRLDVNTGSNDSGDLVVTFRAERRLLSIGDGVHMSSDVCDDADRSTSLRIESATEPPDEALLIVHPTLELADCVKPE